MSDAVDLKAAASTAVEAALAAGGGAAEAWAERSQGREVRVHGGEVESLTAATEAGVGVRAWIEGRAGSAFATDLSEQGLRELAGEAVAAARVADPDQFAAPPEPRGEAPELEGIRDPSLAEWDEASVVELAKAVEQTALDADSRVVSVEQAVYVDADASVAIASSEGIEAGYRASQCYAYLQALAGEAAERQSGLGFQVGRGPAGLDPEAIGTEAAERAVAMLGASKPESRSCPVVLDETVAASFIGFIGGALSAEAVQRGRSPFAGRLGEELASEALVLADDGLDPEGLASGPVDGEGVPRRRTPLIEGRKLSAYLYDTYTARRDDTESTGSASRGSYRSPPSVGPSNLVVEPGSAALEALLGEAADGIYVTDVAGLHSGVNPVSGAFSVGAGGRTIRGGELAEPLREFTIAGELVSMLAAVRAVGSEARWVPFGGSVRTAPLLIGELTVGGA
ncbi:MAG: TldD/PmbA family protein [Solirubrobacterales bacterium]